MTDEIDIPTVHAGFRELFKQAFSTNCMLDDSSVTAEELATLEDLDIQELLENFKELVNGLLGFKKSCKTSEKAELVQLNEQLEQMLQKAEAEIRTHIGIEHQLKIHAELTQTQLDDLSKKYAHAKGTILQLRGSHKDFKRKGNKTERADTPDLRKKTLERAADSKPKMQKERKEAPKRRKPERHSRKGSRRSMGDCELSKVAKANCENRPPTASKQRPASRGHNRSVSEQTKPLVHKKPLTDNLC